jgi:hypothetical protein
VPMQYDGLYEHENGGNILYSFPPPSTHSFVLPLSLFIRCYCSSLQLIVSSKLPFFPLLWFKVQQWNVTVDKQL